MSRTALLAWALLATASGLSAQGVGSQLPPEFEVEGLAQTGASSIDDFHGRALLLEFFAYWCGPCAKSVPHLNELAEAYGARGLSILALTKEKEERTLPWVEKHGVEYAYGFDRSGEIHRWAGVRGIPYAVLLDAQGSVLWSGHPAQLDGAIIEKALLGALTVPLWEWPAETQELRVALIEGRYAAALEQAKLRAQPIGEQPAEALVRARIAGLVASFEGTVAKGEYHAAFQLGARAVQQLAGLPEGERVAAKLAELERDPEVQRLRGGQERLARLEAEAARSQNYRQWETLRDSLAALAREFPGTRIERRSSAMIAELERLIQRAKPR